MRRQLDPLLLQPMQAAAYRRAWMLLLSAILIAVTAPFILALSKIEEPAEPIAGRANRGRGQGLAAACRFFGTIDR